MKQLRDYLVDFWKFEKNKTYFSVIALFLVMLIVLNYSLDFETSILKKYKRTPWYFGLVMLYYAAPYYFACVTYAWAYKKYHFIKSKAFWLISLFGLATQAFSESFYGHSLLLEKYVSSLPSLYFLKVSIGNYVSFFTQFIPLFIYWWIADRKEMPLYGMTNTNFKFKPYLIMLLVMLPLLVVASFQESFLADYPVYNDYDAHSVWGTSEFWNVLFFELGYALDFVTVELFFRGFLIMALARVMGRAVVVPMATLYCVLHFGKPMAEAISSIFGGLVLGIFAYNSRSVFGGILIHVSVALLMELLAFLQKM